MLIEIVVERCKLLLNTLLRVNFPFTSLEPIGHPYKTKGEAMHTESIRF